MTPEVIEETSTENQDYFEVKEKNGMSKIDYMRKNPDLSKVLFEAFYATPDELKIEIYKLKAHIEDKYGDINAAEGIRMKRLFDEIPLRKGVDPDEAYELMNIISEYFRRQLATELTEENKLMDDRSWKEFFDKKSKYINMIRFGIEQSSK